ncbi:MAG: BtrH N-terminal domain-containing protein [Acidobacteriota bacterium]
MDARHAQWAARGPVLLAGYKHRVGYHCSSTSLWNILAYDGVEVSEALAFGLGGGLGFFYLEDDRLTPSRVLNGRAPDLEGSFFAHAGRPLEWAGRWDPAAMESCLRRGRPVLAQTDLFHLPYYQPPVHFPGHGVVVTGLDLRTGTVDISDQGFPEVQRTALENLRLAMEGVAPPLLPAPYRWAEAPRLTQQRLSDPEAFRAAIAQTRRLMAGEVYAHQGLPALARLAEGLPRWMAAPDFGWCARFAYQSIEKRGTGGGAFRYLYGSFLREAAAILPSLAQSRAPALYESAGDGWRALAGAFKEVFVANDPSRFAACAVQARALLELEKRALDALSLAIES